VRPPAVDLVVDRLVLEGGSLDADEAGDLARLIEEELGLLLAEGGRAGHRRSSLVDAKPVALASPADPRALARALAERIAAEAGLPGRLHGRA
jgi:hypothetical protein